jgi:hypothetical protein
LEADRLSFRFASDQPAPQANRYPGKLGLYMADEYEPGDDLPYQGQDGIDFSRMWSVFRELPLFDDTYLNMQAMNIAMVDRFITAQE